MIVCVPVVEWVRVYRTKNDAGWIAVVVKRGVDQSIVRFIKADPEMIGKERCISNRFLEPIRERNTREKREIQR